MDSAFECLVFALNALGQARVPSGFRSIADEKSLKGIKPRDVIGPGSLSGWSDLFPTFQRHCINHASLISLVADNHDVTKHRQAGFPGGRVRTDPPEGFFESLGVPEGHPARLHYAPMQEVMIPLRPKLPMEAQSSDLAAWTRLEVVIPEFTDFINEAVCVAKDDAASRLRLPVPTLRQATEAT